MARDSQRKKRRRVLLPAELRFSLALNTHVEALEGIDNKILPSIFGLGMDSGRTWLFSVAPRNIDPTSLAFVKQAVIVRVHNVDPRLPGNLKERFEGKQCEESGHKPEKLWKRMLENVVSKPGSPRIGRLLEIIRDFEGYSCAIVIHSLYDVTGISRMQFADVAPLRKLTDESNANDDDALWESFVSNLPEFACAEWFVEDDTNAFVDSIKASEDLVIPLPDAKINYDTST